MRTKPYEFTIIGIALDGKNGLPTVILRSVDTKNILPLGIGPFEASAIIIEIENVHPSRPMAHDLLAELFIRHGLKLLNLTVYQKLENDYPARIEYRKRLRHYTMEVRPSDGIALAVRLGTPILVSPEVVQTAEKKASLMDTIENVSTEILYFESNNVGAHLM